MLVWYNHLPSFLPETSGRWRVACLTTWGGGGGILAGKHIIRDSNVFTYIECTFRIKWGVPVSTIFCISYTDDLSGIWSINVWVPFLIMPRAPVTTGIILVLSFHIFVASISRSLCLGSFWNSLREIYLSIRTVTSIMIPVFSSKFFIEMSGRFASIFLSVLIVKSQSIVTSVLSVTGYVVYSYHFFAWVRFYIISSVWN